jgi:hypothetical protein
VFGLATACGSASSDALFNNAGAPGGGGISTFAAGGHQSASGGTGNSGGRNTASGGFVAAGSGAVISSGGFDAAGGATQSGSGSTSSGGIVEPGSGGTTTGTGGVTGNGGTASGGVIGAGGAPLPTCTDRIKNQDETDIDCGGATCSPCLPGQICKLPRDCSTNVCPGGILGLGLCRIATCLDGIQNGQETDVDCGGSQCDPCPTGKKCSVNSDCMYAPYGSCHSGVCACTPVTCNQMPTACGPGVSDGCGHTQTCQACSLLCNDSIKDGKETAADCGGPDCGKCPNNATCALPSDCQSGVCNAARALAPLTCRPPTCTDKVKNGDETDVDCGGSCPTKCGNGHPCIANTDCSSGSCSSNVCACKPSTCADKPTQCGSLSNDCGGTMQCSCKPLCMDDVKDGHETDVNCGGGDCPPCATGLICLVNGDCQSGNCADPSGGTALVCQ